MTKKKKIIIISVCVILVAAIAITVGVVCSKKNKDNTYAGEETQIVAVTDENGETVTDENGEAVTEIEHIENDASNGNSSVSNQGGQGSGSSGNSSNGSSGGSSGGNSSGNLQETTEPPTHYTTMSENDKNTLPEDSFDDTIPQFNALLFLQEYYGSNYVVNYDIYNTTDEIYAFTVFEKSGDGTDIAYTVTVHNISGKTIQTDSKGKSTDISDKITY